VESEKIAIYFLRADFVLGAGLLGFLSGLQGLTDCLGWLCFWGLGGRVCFWVQLMAADAWDWLPQHRFFDGETAMVSTGSFWFFLRYIVGGLAALLVSPFVLLAVAPMLLVLAPVALMAMPFMLSAFAGEAKEVRHSIAPRALPVFRQQAAH
jgi:hypothetical protein